MKSGINKSGTVVAPAVLLVLLLLTAVASAGARSVPPPPSTWHGTGCVGYNTDGAMSYACSYPGSPFLLSGYSNGGSSTLSYVLQCRKGYLPTNPVVIYPKVLYSHSQSVKGNFKVYGLKSVATSGSCSANQNKSTVLTATLRQGSSKPSILLRITLDGTLPWGKTPKKPNYRLVVNIIGPSTVTNDGSSTYVYKLPVSNTGKLKIGRLQLHFAPVGLVSGSSVHWSSSGNVVVSNLRAGTKRTITVRLNPQASTASSWNLKFTAKGLGTAKKASSSASETVDVTTVTTTTG